MLTPFTTRKWVMFPFKTKSLQIPE